MVRAKKPEADEAKPASHRFKAPKHAGEVFLPSGVKPVRGGIVTLAADAPLSDHHALIRAGFVPLPSGDPSPETLVEAEANEEAELEADVSSGDQPAAE